MNGDENSEKTRLSTILVLKDVFSEDRLKEYLNDAEKKYERTRVVTILCIDMNK